MNSKYIYNVDGYKIEYFILIGIISIFFSGFFYELNYSSTKEFLILLFLSLIILSVNLLFKKFNKWIDILLSVIVLCLKNTENSENKVSTQISLYDFHN